MLEILFLIYKTVSSRKLRNKILVDKRNDRFMKKMIKNILLCLGFCCALQTLKAQDLSENAEPKKSQWQVGVSYLNNSVYLGRQDSLKVSYVTPSITYFNKSGLYVSSLLYYLNSSGERRIDLFEIQTGYNFTLNKFDGEISISKDFYNTQSKNVQSETKGDGNISLSYDLGFIKPSLQGGIAFNKKNDYNASFGIEHPFFLLDDNLEIDPSFLLNASTQNYYESYYSIRRYSGKRKKQTGSGVLISANLPNASKFKIMDYEWSLPINYTLGKFNFNFAPTLAIPLNPNIVVLSVKSPSGVTTSSQTRTENLSNIFFWSTGVSYNF